MSELVSLKKAERKVFTAATQDGLWDIFIGCFPLQLAVGPFLSPSLGDYWASAVFVPLWVMVLVGIWLVRKHVLAPRLGKVSYGTARKRSLRRFTALMLTLNIIALALGIWAALGSGGSSGRMIGVGLGLVCLVGFSFAAYTLSYHRLYLYGLMFGLSPVVGEWLWERGVVSHHGFPITFGITAAVMFLTGTVVFVRLLRNNPARAEGTPLEET